MSTNFQAGIGSVGSYQVSGIPYLTGAVITVGEEQRIQFPYVVKSVLVQNREDNGVGNGHIRVHFNATGSGDVVSGKHYFPLGPMDEDITMNVKCSEIYVSCPLLQPNGGANLDAEWYLVAELTGIRSAEMFVLTGSGLTE